MIPSKYNYILPFGEKYIFFNGITESFFIVSASHLDDYCKVISNPNENQLNFSNFIDKMKNLGFIIDDDIDETDRIKHKFHSLRFPNRYYLMVLPTYQCNLRCWYCIQKHENMFMSDETLHRVKELIKRKLSNDDITEFHLSWFGGEPLMAYDQLLDLTRFSRDYANSCGKHFSSAITTNGTLLTPERIRALHEAGVDSYQITIDGDKSTHDSIKELGAISAYDQTLSNVNLIARHSYVNLRFNYTHDNLRPYKIIESLKSILNPDIVKNISFTMFKVWQENEDAVSEEDVNLLFNLSKRHGMHSALVGVGLCYADGIHYDCVFPNGKVGKCDNHSPEDMAGILQHDGTILWKEDMATYYQPHLFDGQQEECDNCRYLPVCWGPCVAKRETMLKTTGKIKCRYEDSDKSMEKLILDTCKTILQKTK